MATIHDQSYRRYEGTRVPADRAWNLILTTGLRALLVRKSFLALLVLAWLPWLVRTVQIYAAVSYPGAADFLRVDASLFVRFLDQQGVFVFFVTIYAGAGLVAHDRRANALPLYLSRPITRGQYIAGKLGILAAALAGVTLVPALLLLVFQTLLSGSLTMLREAPFIVPAVVLSASLTVAVASLTMLALSALAGSARSAALSFAAAVFFSSAVARVLGAVADSSTFAWISMTANLERVTNALFQQPVRDDLPVGLAVGALAGVMVLAGIVLERRVRAIEVVT